MQTYFNHMRKQRRFVVAVAAVEQVGMAGGWEGGIEEEE